MPRPPLYRQKLAQWEGHMESLNYSMRTIRLYVTCCHVAWKYGESREWPQDPKKIESGQVREYLEWLRRYSTATQASYAKALLLFLKWAGNQNVKQFRLRITVTRSRVDWLTVEETSMVIASAPNLWTRAMEILFAYTGIRLSELSYLRMSDMHEDHIVVIGKGSKGRRIPVTKQFWQALQPYMDWRKTIDSPLFMCHPASGGQPVGPYTKDGISTAIWNHQQKIGRHLSPHTFRRSYGRHLYKAGMPLQEIQRLYGHASLAVTIAYLGINDEDLATSVEKYQPAYM